MAKNPFTPEFEKLPDTLPIFPLKGAIVLPLAQLPLNIFEPRYLNMVFDALSETRMIGMIQPGPGDEKALYGIGCAGRITSFRETDDGRLLIGLTGICRFDVGEEISTVRGYRRIIPNWQRYAADYVEDETLIDTAELMATLSAFFQTANVTADMDALKAMGGPQLVNFLAVHLPLESSDKQALVEASDVAERLQILTTLTRLSASTQAGSKPTRH